jgi:hypothetical protein
MTLSAANERVVRLRQEKEMLDETLKKMEPDGKRLTAIDEWTKREVVWLDELYDMTDRFPVNDTVRLNSFNGKAHAVTKDGKQPKGQAEIELRVGQKSPDAAIALSSSIERENTSTARFYASTQPKPAGQAPGGGVYNQLWIITTDVSRRNPDQYTRNPAFITPSRRMNGGTLASTPQPEEKKADPDMTDPDMTEPGEPE